MSNRINKSDKKAFKVVEKNERNHSFDDLLTKEKSVSIYPEIYNF